MQNQEPSLVYDKDRAAAFDTQVAKLAPMRDALHFLMRMVLSELPDDARILCVGAGTGAELIALAQAFPHWRFTALDPAKHHAEHMSPTRWSGLYNVTLHLSRGLS